MTRRRRLLLVGLIGSVVSAAGLSIFRPMQMEYAPSKSGWVFVSLRNTNFTLSWLSISVPNGEGVPYFQDAKAFQRRPSGRLISLRTTPTLFMVQDGSLSGFRLDLNLPLLLAGSGLLGYAARWVRRNKPRLWIYEIKSPSDLMGHKLSMVRRFRRLAICLLAIMGVMPPVLWCAFAFVPDFETDRLETERPRLRWAPDSMGLSLYLAWNKKLFSFQECIGSPRWFGVTVDVPSDGSVCSSKAQVGPFQVSKRLWKHQAFLGWWEKLVNKEGAPVGVDRCLTTLFMPIWAPLVFFACCVAYPLAAFIRGPLRRTRRRQQGRCVICGYSLQGSSAPRCPECGTPSSTDIAAIGSDTAP